jgi:opacity protein-like surface antigen
MSASALAADIADPIIEAPVEVIVPQAVGGWYIRGDIDYHWLNFGGADYILYGEATGERGKFDEGELKGAMSLGAGIGYQVNDYFRVDLTGDYFFESDFEGSTSGFCLDGVPCTSDDRSSMRAFVLMANAYVDLGTYHGFTPYVGGGIGGANIKWDTLVNTDLNGRFEHEGSSEWRFAYAAMAGVSYCLTGNTKLDLGYRYSHIQGGEMFGFAVGAGPGFDDGFDVHEVRAGLRYQFTGNNGCASAAPVAYEPPPVYVPAPGGSSGGFESAIYKQ